MQQYLPKNWKELVGWAVLMGASALAGWLGYGTFVPQPPPLPVWLNEQGHTQRAAFGWAENPKAVEAIASKLPFPVFADTEAGKSDDPLPDRVYLWQVFKKIDARGPPTKNQGQVGSCVSFGTNNAITRTMAFEIAVLKRNFEFKDIAEEVTYAGSRVEIGGGRISGDGSVGAWAADFVKKWGVVSRGIHGTHDLTSYNEPRCRSWGKSGVPAELETIAREHPVQTITQVKTWEEAKRALANGYGIAICSSQGFSMQRDSRGVARPSGSWPHCMCLDGFHLEGGSEFGHIENSWGSNSHTGPVGWGEPSTAGFWADSATIDRMLRANDSWAFSAVKGFPARKLDWFVRLEAELHQDRMAKLMEQARTRNLFAQLSKGVSANAIRN